MSRLKKVWLRKIKKDRRTQLVTIIFAVLVGFLLVRAFAGTKIVIDDPTKSPPKLPTELSLYYNSSGVRHTTGNAVSDSQLSYKVWEDRPRDGYSWWGPFRDMQAGTYNACFYVRVVSGGDLAELYTDVTKKSGNGRALVDSLTWHPATAYYTGYNEPLCLTYRLETAGDDMEWRADVKAGTIRIARVGVYRVGP